MERSDNESKMPLYTKIVVWLFMILLVYCMLNLKK